MLYKCWDPGSWISGCRGRAHTVKVWAVGCTIRFTGEINVFKQGGDWERSRPPGSENTHNLLMTLREISSACDHVAEMLLILISTLSTWLMEVKSSIWPCKEKSHDFDWAQTFSFKFCPNYSLLFSINGCHAGFWIRSSLAVSACQINRLFLFVHS